MMFGTISFRLRAAVLAATTVLACPAVLAGGITSWMMKINEAADSLNYRGNFVYVHDGQIESMQVARLMTPDGTHERIYSLNGNPREIIRDENAVWCYLPDKKTGVHQYRQATDRSFPSLLAADISALDAHYELSLGPLDRIAGRTAQVVMVNPRDDYRFGYVLWADSLTGLLLRADLIDSAGSSLEQYMFTSVEIDGDIDPSDLEPMTDRESLQWFGVSDDDAPPTIHSNWSVRMVPDGFRLTQSISRRSPMDQAPMQHLVFSDGLAAVSVFIQEVEEGKQDNGRIQGLSSMGAISAFGALHGDYQVTVVGEVPAATVDMMGMSVVRDE